MRRTVFLVPQACRMKAPGRTQPLILVVDQEQAVLDEVSAILAEAGFACHRCLTAEAALEAAPLLLPELIIADVSLQASAGWNCAAGSGRT